MTIAPVIRAVTVDTPPDRAFAVFTAHIGEWWPLATHSASEELAADLSFVDGALVETSPDGDPSVWGQVTEWDPPTRLALTWSPSGGPVTSIVVDFEPTDGGTRVILSHVGWEAYGDKAAEIREGYGGDHAWAWILELFALAAHTPLGNVAAPSSDKPAFDVAPLRSGYEAVALALEVGSFADPDPGEWNARQVAGHVATNAELMSRVVDDVRAGRAARLNGPEDHAGDAIGRFDELTYGELAGRLRLTFAELVARCAALSEDELSTPVSTYIEHDREPVVDGEMTLSDLLGAQVGYHLPAHVEQIADLEKQALAD